MTFSNAADDSSVVSVMGMVVDDFLERRGRGELPSVDDYAAQYPDFADLIKDVLPMMEVIPATSESTPTSVPQRIGDFQIVGEIGHGGMGVVYEAVQLSLKRRVALKILPSLRRASAKRRARFAHEAQVCASLEHPNIVPVHTYDMAGDHCYFAMRLIRGCSLADVIKERANHVYSGPTLSRENAEDEGNPYGFVVNNAATEGGDQPSDSNGSPSTAIERNQLSAHFSKDLFHRAADLGYQIADALRYAHERGVIHRDIKPSNILLDVDGKPWVTDFGVALVHDEAGLTQTGEVVGTLRYMSPEQASESRYVDPRTDIYSLGATLYEVLASRPMIASEDRKSVFKRLRDEDEAPPLRSLNPHVPVDLETIVMKAVSKDRDERYDSAAALADDLGRFLSGKPIHAKPPTLMDRTSKWARRNRSLVTTAASFLVVVLVVSVISLITLAGAFHRERSIRVQLEEALRDNRRQLSRIYVRNAGLLGKKDPLGALPWLAEAVRLDEGDPTRERISRIRFAAVLRECPKLEKIWFGPDARMVRLSADGKTAFTLDREGGALRIWDTGSGEVKRVLESESPVTWFGLERTSSTLATSHEDGNIVVRDIGTLSPKATIRFPKGFGRVTISPDGELLAMTNREGTIHVYRIGDLERPPVSMRHADRVKSMTFDHQSRRLLTGSADNTARLWDARTGEAVTPPLTHHDDVHDARFNPSGSIIATGGHDGVVKLWDSDTGSLFKTLQAESGEMRRISFSPNGQNLVTVSAPDYRRYMVTLWDVATGDTAVHDAAKSHVKDIVWGKNGDRFIVVSSSIRQFDTSGKEFPPIAEAPTSDVFSTDRGAVCLTVDDGVYRSWEFSPAPKRWIETDGHRVHRADAHLETETLALVTGDGLFRIADLRNGAQAVASRPVENVKVVRFNADGSKIAVSLQDGVIVFFDRKAKVIRESHHSEYLADLQFASDHVVFADWKHRIGVIDLENGQTRILTQPHVRAAKMAIASLTGQAVVATKSNITVWDLPTKAPSKSWLSSGVPSSTAFSRDGRFLTLGMDRSTRIFDVRQGKAVGPEIRHSGRADAVAVHPNGSIVCIGDRDGIVTLWDVGNSRSIALPMRHAHRIDRVEFSDSGDVLASTDHEGIVSLWDPSTGEAISYPIEPPFDVELVGSHDDARTVCHLGTRGEFLSTEFLPDRRSFEQLIALSAVLSGKRVSSAGALDNSDRGDFERAWRQFSYAPDGSNVDLSEQ